MVLFVEVEAEPLEFVVDFEAFVVVGTSFKLAFVIEDPALFESGAVCVELLLDDTIVMHAN